ncbi:MAG TPA: S41 family peptidase, partial [Gemmataceae bacterium]|nr:S41 family peptidase [Gemmataceae bacterium]
AGEPGSAVELQIVPAGATSPVNFKLVRQSVFYRMLERKDGSAEEGIGYVQLIGFQKTTVHELEEAILRLKRDGGMRALILDLRGNPGGSFRVAVQVAERFLADGVIVSAQSQIRTYNRTFESRSGPNAIDIPLIVLIDGDTASAAELLAGALKENHRALLIGTTTYGKGTIQAVLPLHNLPAEAPAALRLTLARFFSPRGHAYNDTGVTPDRVVLDKDGQLQIALQEAAQLIRLLP